MPHRPEGQGSANLSPGGVVNASPVYTPPRVAGSTAAAIMRQQTAEGARHVGMQYAGVVTPVVKTKLNWLSASNKSVDSMDRSTATTTDDSRSIATLATEDEREATASALLMVAKAAEREQQQIYLKGMVVDGENDRPNGVPPAVSSSASTCSSSTVPLKKRKKQLDILRRQQHQTKEEACHVSPVSHDSGNPPGNRTQSYDSKDLGSSVASPQGESTQELLDSSKIHSTAQIGAGSSLPVSQVLIPHFPTVLHQVLADKKNADEKTAIIRWLPDGESWKVENWNAMRRQILPKYFSDLRDENGSSCGTIDAFLHNIDAWGFEEIKNGPSAGAYRHNLFIRGAQKLCVKMRLSSENDTANKKGPKTVSPFRSGADETGRMMLQVPMLATADSKKQQSMPPNKRPRFESAAMGQAGHGALHWPYSKEAAQGVAWGGATGQFNEMSNARAFGMRVAMNGSYAAQVGSYGVDPRLQLLRMPASESMLLQRQQQHQPFQYNPPQVRSGRGALRGMAAATQQNRGVMVTSPSTTPSFRHGFPVSNRGKGSRKAAAIRTPLSSDSKTVSSSTPPPTKPATPESEVSTSAGVSLSEAQRIGNSVKGGVAVAISRKTKRKLPLARKGVIEAESGVSTTTVAEKAAV